MEILRYTAFSTMLATAVAHARKYGVRNLQLNTKAGPVPVSTTINDNGETVATLTSVPPRTTP